LISPFANPAEQLETSWAVHNRGVVNSLGVTRMPRSATRSKRCWRRIGGRSVHRIFGINHQRW